MHFSWPRSESHGRATDVCALLIVEPDPADADRFVCAIRASGLNLPLQPVNSAAFALNFLRRHADELQLIEPGRPLVLVTELDLPDMDGIEFLEALHRLPNMQKLPIVCFTRRADQTAIDRAYDLRANSYILKSDDSEAFQQSAVAIARHWCRFAETVFTV